MTITAAQIRDARRLLRWSSAMLTKRSGVLIGVVLKAQLDAEVGTVHPMALLGIRLAFTQAGVDFTSAGVRLRGRKPPTPAPEQSDRTEPA